MGEFNSDDHMSTTMGKNPLEGMEGVALSQQEFEMQYLVAISKMTE